VKNLLLVFLIFLSACKDNSKIAKPAKNNFFQYARHVSYQDYGNFKILKVHEPYPGAPGFTYVLKSGNIALPDSLKNHLIIEVPLKNIVVTSTTHLPALQVLDLSENLIGFPNLSYISNPVFRKMIKENKLADVGNGRLLNTEKLLLLQPDLIMHFNSGSEQNDDKFYIEKGIPVLYNADWMEQNPLGRAEWLKVFGILFGKTKQANRIFKRIEERYLAVKSQIDTTADKPKVFQGGVFGDKWFVPGGNSYATQLIKDAGGSYLWQHNKSTGSLSLNFENVLQKLPEADVWLNPGMFTSKEALTKGLPAVKTFKVYKNDRIFTYNLTRGPGGGVLYFEESNLYPDRVLSDLFHIFYPSKSQSKRLYYYKKLP